MNARQRGREADPEPVFGAALMPVRWLLLLGLAASVHLPFSPAVHLNREHVLAAEAIYAAAIALLTRRPPGAPSSRPCPLLDSANDASW